MTSPAEHDALGARRQTQRQRIRQRLVGLPDADRRRAEDILYGSSAGVPLGVGAARRAGRQARPGRVARRSAADPSGPAGESADLPAPSRVRDARGPGRPARLPHPRQPAVLSDAGEPVARAFLDALAEAVAESALRDLRDGTVASHPAQEGPA